MSRGKSIEDFRGAYAKEIMRGPWKPFEKVDLSTAKNVPPFCTRSFKNNYFIVTIDDYSETSVGYATRAMVQKWDDTPIGWMELQRVKNMVFGDEAVAVQYFPAESELVNDKNIYWLFLYPDGLLPTPKAAHA